MTGPQPSPARRWHHRLRHSLRWRLVTLFLLLALALSVAFVGGIQKSFAVGWRDAVRPLLADYVDRLTAELGSPPDAQRARALVARLPISIRIDGPVTRFDSHPQRYDDRRDAPWRRGEYGGDIASARLLERATADGHSVAFGLGDLNWRRGPGAFVWVTLSVLLVLTGLAFVYIRHLLKPLDDIGAGAQRFGVGDFSQPIVVRRGDELGDLAGQINTMGQDIHQMLEAKRGLLLAISHELRSPLTRARLNVELLPDSAELPEVRAPREALLRDLNEMAQLITDLLESERLSGNHTALNRVPVDLGELIHEVVAELAATNPGASYALDVPSDLPVMQLDRSRIKLLVRNLLDNARRHGARAQGEAPPRPADVAVRHTAGELVLTVRDHGAGVTNEQLAHLAEPFFRADTGRLRSTGGVGLGLYLCRLVAQAHGGKFAVRNAHPGLEVTVSLPITSDG